MKTPSNRIIFMLLLNLGWFGIMPGVIAYYSFCLNRGDYPTNADSISIPIFGIFFVLLILAPLINGAVYLFLRNFDFINNVGYSFSMVARNKFGGY